VASEIFFVAGLFTDKKYFSAASAFAKDGLRTALPEIASFAIGSGLAKSF